MIDFVTDAEGVNEWFWERTGRAATIKQDENGSFEARVYDELDSEFEGIGTGETYEDALSEAVLDYQQQFGI